MKNIKYLLLILIVLSMLSCEEKTERKIEKFSIQKPYSIEVSKERSFYQAEKIRNRLLNMGLDAYIIQYDDTVKDEGKWFHILCETETSLDSAKSLRTRLEKKYNLPDLKIASFNNFSDAVINIDTSLIKEKKNIKSKKPNLPDDVYKVIQKFPESNSLFLKKLFVINSPEDYEKRKGYNVIYSFQTDLPRGITKKMMLKNTTAFSEVIYNDNLYGDRVVLDIAKLRKPKPIISEASILGLTSGNKSDIAKEYAELILNTGEYLFEEMKPINIMSYTLLKGYKVTIEPKKNYFRTYLVLTDKNSQYIIFSQSTDKTEEELVSILSDIGKGNGLLNYDEFYNTFYTLPENLPDNDIFIGFDIDKLGWTYAKNKGYTKWAKEMVGHWNASGYFYNTKKGLWSYSIFDLLNRDEQEYIYQNLYKNQFGVNKNTIDVYGTSGIVVYEEKFNWDNFTTYKKISEINFAFDRYVCAVGNSNSSWFNKEDLLLRSESLQLEKENSSNNVLQ